VVSIEVEGKAGPRRIGLDEGDDDGRGGGLPPELRRFFQQVPQGQQPKAQPMHGAGSGSLSRRRLSGDNNHVVENADKITVHMSDDRTFQARVIGRDPATDLAVIKVDARTAPSSLRGSRQAAVGDWVGGCGQSVNLGGTATAGIVSALGRKKPVGLQLRRLHADRRPDHRGIPAARPSTSPAGGGRQQHDYSPTGGSVGIGFDIPPTWWPRSPSN